MIRGIDVGVDQGDITFEHWKRLAGEERIGFALLRCAGTTQPDPTFTANVAGAGDSSPAPRNATDLTCGEHARFVVAGGTRGILRGDSRADRPRDHGP